MADTAESTVEEIEVPEDEDVETSEEVDEPESDELDDSQQEEQTEEDEEPVFQKRFTQLKGETPEEYIPNLEEAYQHSSTEALRLSAEVKDLRARLDQTAAMIAQGTDPAVAPVQPVATDPALQWARDEYERRSTEEFNDFTAQHPEVLTDPVLGTRVNDALKVVSDTMAQTQGRRPTMSEGLRLAWLSMGMPLDNQEESTAMAVKQSAAQSKTPGGRPAVQKRSQFSKQQLDVAKKLYGPVNPETGKDFTDGELEAKLAEYI